MATFSTPIGDGKTVEIEVWKRNLTVVPWRDAILLARKHLNKEAPQRNQSEDPEVERLAHLLVSVMEGTKEGLMRSITLVKESSINNFRQTLTAGINDLSV